MRTRAAMMAATSIGGISGGCSDCLFVGDQIGDILSVWIWYMYSVVICMSVSTLSGVSGLNSAKYLPSAGVTKFGPSGTSDLSEFYRDASVSKIVLSGSVRSM